MSLDVKSTTIYTELKRRDSEFLGAIDAVTPIVEQRLEVQIPKLFPEYTLHNIQHSIRVMEYMSEIITDIDSFNDFELALMLLSALLHDLGMALGESEINEIRKDHFFSKKDIKFNAFVKIYGDNAIQEIVRRNHAHISSKIISEIQYKNHFILSEPHGLSYIEDIKLLCESHTKDQLWISNSLSTQNIKGQYEYNLRFIAYVIRIADLLDIDQNRTPFELYKLINPKGVGDEEWRQHFIVTNTKKIKLNPKTEYKDIVFYGKSEDIKIHRKLMSYINWINDELKVFNDFNEQLNDDKLKCKLSNQVVTNIETIGFTVPDYLLSLDFKSITELLMGENIYGDRKLGLREIIQNSIDACLVRKEIEDQNSGYQPTITIIINNEKNCFTISDNGIGMSEEIIKNFFLNIGRSFYKSDVFKLNDYAYKPIGSFGIGFLACFMLSEDVTMQTRYYKSAEKHTVQLEKGDKYIGFNSVEDISFNGTKIDLKLDQVLSVFNGDANNIVSFINTFFVNDDYELKIINGAEQIKISNTIQDIKKPVKNEITFDISKYINDAKGFVKIKNSHSFIRDLTDLNIIGDNLFYIPIPEGNYIKRKVIFDDIVDTKTNKLVYIHLPLYTDDQRDEFEHALSILDGDIDNALEKIESLDNAYLFFPCRDQRELDEKEVFDETDPQIYEQVFVSDINKELCENYFCPKIKVIEVNLLEENSFKILEEFKPFNNYSWSWRQKDCKLFLRNILIKDYEYSKQLMVKTIDLQGFSLNFYKSDILPNISRNHLLPESKKSVDNSINIAIHLSAIENFNLKEDERKIILKFIKTKLIINNHFIRQEVLENYSL